MTQRTKFLTVPQAAAALEVSDQAVRDWIHAGKLQAIRLPGGRFKIRREAVQAIVAGALLDEAAQ